MQLITLWFISLPKNSTSRRPQLLTFYRHIASICQPFHQPVTMNSVMGLDSRHKSTPRHAALFSMVTILLVAIVEKIGEFGSSLAEKVVLDGWVIEHAVIKEYGGPVDGCKSCNYF